MTAKDLKGRDHLSDQPNASITDPSTTPEPQAPEAAPAAKSSEETKEPATNPGSALGLPDSVAGLAPQATDASRDMFAPREASRMLGISERSLWTRVNEGTILTKRLGGRVLFPIDALRELMNVNNQTSEGEDQ